MKSQECWNFKGLNLFQLMLRNYLPNCMAGATFVLVLFMKNDFDNFSSCHRIFPFSMSTFSNDAHFNCKSFASASWKKGILKH